MLWIEAFSISDNLGTVLQEQLDNALGAPFTGEVQRYMIRLGISVQTGRSRN